jgi:glycerol-3-phosphate dehydrogenase (NAD(P)+)
MACVLRRAGHEVVLWAREPEVVAAINGDGMNPVFLPGVRLEPGILATGELARTADRADFLLVAVPAQHARAVTQKLRPAVRDGTPVVACSKGIERGSCALMPEVIAESLPAARVAVLSGPSFAHEIAAGLPAGVALASADIALAGQLARAIGCARFGVSASDDMTGVSLGGALKNVFAIACGIAVGQRLGGSARATLVARSLAEMVRLGAAMGARGETFMGVAGIGDLDLCCNSTTSRNMSLGIALGEGRRLEEILAGRITVQEGVHSAESVASLARRHETDMPIAFAVDAILNHGGDARARMEALWAVPRAR